MELLLYLLDNAETTLDSCNMLSEVSAMMLQDLVFPNAIWKAGRMETAARAVAIECLARLFMVKGPKDKGPEFLGYVPVSFLHAEQGESAPGVQSDGDETLLRRLIVPILSNAMDEELLAVRQTAMNIVYVLSDGHAFKTGIA